MKITELKQVPKDKRGSYLKNGYKEAEKYVIKLFCGNKNLRRMLLITKDGKVLDFFKR